MGIHEIGLEIILMFRSKDVTERMWNPFFYCNYNFSQRIHSAWHTFSAILEHRNEVLYKQDLPFWYTTLLYDRHVIRSSSAKPHISSLYADLYPNKTILFVQLHHQRPSKHSPCLWECCQYLGGRIGRGDRHSAQIIPLH